MKQWLKKRNRKLLYSITKKTYNINLFERDKLTLRNMYNGDFDHYVDAVDKAFETRKAEKNSMLSKREKFTLKVELNIYYITKSIEDVLTRKERKNQRKNKIKRINNELNALREKYRVASHIIREVKDTLIKEYENGLDGLKK